jgi:hypothetical protein
MKYLFSAIMIMFSLGIFTTRIVKGVTFKQNCSGFLKRAADANSSETALKEISKSIDYLEANNMTSGYTSVVWKTPDEDVSFFYNNLKASQKELSKIDSTTSSLEKTNVLMKLRETLMDGGKDGDSLTIPTGLAVFPNNGFWAFLMVMALIMLIGPIIYIFITSDDY